MEGEYLNGQMKCEIGEGDYSESKHSISLI